MPRIPTRTLWSSIQTREVAIYPCCLLGWPAHFPGAIQTPDMFSHPNPPLATPEIWPRSAQEGNQLILSAGQCGRSFSSWVAFRVTRGAAQRPALPLLGPMAHALGATLEDSPVDSRTASGTFRDRYREKFACSSPFLEPSKLSELALGSQRHVSYWARRRRLQRSRQQSRAYLGRSPYCIPFHFLCAPSG